LHTLYWPTAILMIEATDEDTDTVLNCELIRHRHLYDIAFYY